MWGEHTTNIIATIEPEFEEWSRLAACLPVVVRAAEDPILET